MSKKPLRDKPKYLPDQTVCMCVRTCACIHISKTIIYIYIYIYIYLCVSTHVRICIHGCVYTCAYACISMRVCVYVDDIRNKFIELEAKLTLKRELANSQLEVRTIHTIPHRA